MKNFIFISPDFPKTYSGFTRELRNAGFTVLGISEAPYDNLSYELRDSLTEYYRVNSMESYDEMFRAIAYFTYKYGHIDFIESNNEYWLRQDAKLREDFNVTTGKRGKEINMFQSKELEKRYYKKAEVKVARYVIPTTINKALKFIDEVSYPVIVKPVIGVGASKTHKISNYDELVKFFNEKQNIKYIMEEYVDGDLISFDGVSNSKCEVVFYSNEVFPDPVMDVVNEKKDFVYYSNKETPEDLIDAGKRVIKAFKAKNRYFHLEFFRLKKDKKGLGRKGELIGLEVNMRPPGGYTPDVINYSKSVNSYKVWADTMMNDYTFEDLNREKFYCLYIGRRHIHQYEFDNDQIYSKYGQNIVGHDFMPNILSDAMGEEFYMFKFSQKEELEGCIKDLLKIK
ncbi:MAG: ATP-grasp domain-containing protein [Gammaproteobacteria bacterium]|nr:ATP-grasp domain-containing protein [Gammaproteobacteria bacterium]